MAYNYKNDFPIFQHTDVAYIDNAATAQRPQCVLDAVADFYRCHNANPLRGLYPLSVEATDIYEQARETVRGFIGAKSAREIIFTRNTTESLNLVAYSYGLTHVKAGDEVLVSIMEHHSNLLPWQMVCRQTGAELKFIECAPDGSVDLKQIESLITERTKIFKRGQDAAYTEDDETFVPLAGDSLVSMNFWGFTPQILEEIWDKFPGFLEENLKTNPEKCEFYLPTVVNNQLLDHRADVRVLPCMESWYGVTYKEDLPNVKAAIGRLKQEGKYTERLWD